MPKVRRIAVSSRVPAAKRASELDETTNIQRKRASAVVISSARPGARCASSSVVPTSCSGMTPTWAPPRAGWISCARGSRIGGGSSGSSTTGGGAAAPVAAAASGCPRGRGFPPAASASRATALRPADRPARRGSGHRPGSPCRARRAPHAPASGRARRLRARDRSAAGAVPPGSPPPAPPARAAAPRPRVRARSRSRSRSVVSQVSKVGSMPSRSSSRSPSSRDSDAGCSVVARITSSTSTQTTPGRSER